MPGLDCEVLVDLRFFHGLLGRDALFFHCTLRFDFRFIGFAGTRGFGLRNQCCLLGFRVGDFALLRQRGKFFFAGDVEFLARCFEILGAYLDFGLLLDVVALLAARLRFFRQTGETFGIEGIVRIEESLVGLVQTGQRHRFQFQAVLFQIFCHRILHCLHEVTALVLQFLHRHGGGSRAQCIDEFVFDQFLQRVRIFGALAERLCRGADGFGSLLDAHEKAGHHVDAHPVFGDETAFVAATHFQLQGIHVDQDDFVEDRQHDCAAIRDHLLSAQAGTHEGQLLGRAFVQARENQADGNDGDEADAGQHTDFDQLFHVVCFSLCDLCDFYKSAGCGLRIAR